MKRILTCWLVLVFSICTGAVEQAEQNRSSMFQPEQIRADFEQLYAELQEAHYDLFANVDKAEYDTHFAHYLKSIQQPMTEAAVREHFQRFMALGKIAHANIDLPLQDFMQYRQQGGTMLPLFVKIEQGGVFVDQFYGDTKYLNPGSRILAINDRSIESWLSEFRGLVSADNRTLSNTLIESRFPFLIWLSSQTQETFTVTTISHEQTHTEQVSALTREQQQSFAEQLPVPSIDFQSRAATISVENTAYLRPGPFYNSTPGAENIWDSTAFEDFIDAAFAQFIEQGSEVLIVDLRNNPGGNNSFSDYMLAWFADKPFKFASDFEVKISRQSELANEQRLSLSNDENDMSHQLARFYQQHRHGTRASFDLPYATPRAGERYSGKVYLLVNRYSYSNAVNVAAITQDYGFATVIGEKTADLATTYGAMEHFVLDNTQIRVGYPKALITRPNGNKQPDGVTPDKSVDLPNELELTELIQQVLTHI